jgi:hypothetical protein
MRLSVWCLPRTRATFVSCCVALVSLSSQARCDGLLDKLWDGVGSTTSGMVGSSLSAAQHVLAGSYAEISDITPILSQLGFHLDTVEFSTSILVFDSGATATFSSDTTPVDDQVVAALKTKFENDAAKRVVIWTAVEAKSLEQKLGFRTVMLRLKLGLPPRARTCLVNAEANRIWPCQ